MFDVALLLAPKLPAVLLSSRVEPCELKDVGAGSMTTEVEDVAVPGRWYCGENAEKAGP